jgi:hypothetical protein
VVGGDHHWRWLKGMIILRQPWWFFGKCLLIISANQTMFLIS